MTTAVNAIPNERQLVRAFLGTEAFLGTLVAPTYKIYGDLRLVRSRPLADRKEYAGTRFAKYTAVRGAVSVDGTYVQPLTYEDLPILGRYGLVGGGTGVTDGNPTPGYTYTQQPSATKFDIDYASGEYFYPGMPFQFTGLHWPEFTISGDIDDAEAVWKWNSRALALTKDLKTVTSITATGGSTTTIVKSAAGWTVNQFQGAYVLGKSGTSANIGQVREILSNDTTTLTLAGALPAAVVNTDVWEISGVFMAGITDRTREAIDFPGTALYLDTASPIGTTQMSGRWISFSATWANNSFGKRFAENTLGYGRFGFGEHMVSGQIRFEFDRRAEYDDWVAGNAKKIRIQKVGSAINVSPNTFKTATIDILNAQYNAFTDDDRQENVTATITFFGYVDQSAAIPAKITTINRLATLP